MIVIDKTIQEIAIQVQAEIKAEMNIDLSIDEIIKMFDMQFSKGVVTAFQQCRDIKLDYVGKFQILDKDREKYANEIKKIQQPLANNKN